MCRGWSLDELGQKCLVSRQYLHQLESGIKLPSSEFIAVLAAELGVKPEFFSMNAQNQVRVEQVHFRKQATTPLYIASQVVARGTMMDRLVEVVERHLRLPAVNFPRVQVENFHDVERAAQNARAVWGLGSDAPITNVIRVAENAGAVVTHFSGLSERVDALSMDRPRPIIVRGDAKASLARQRFDIAHEIGHLIMHQGLVTGDAVTERQAHRFAGAFMIPAKQFEIDFPLTSRIDWNALYRMKLKWKLSLRAIIHRAFDLGLISPSQYRSANIHLMKTGQSKVERYDDELALEVPELMVAAMRQITSKPGRLKSVLDELGISSDMLITMIGDEWIDAGGASNVVPFSKPSAP